MSATVSPIIVREFPAIAADADAMQQLRDGLANCLAAVVPPELEHLISSKVGFDWDHLLDAVIADVAHLTAALLQTTVECRLPWTWEPER